MTHAVSPLKVYEYLASGVPVAAPPLRALDGLDGVSVDEDLVEAVRRALDGDEPDAASVIDQHSWKERVAKIVDLAGVASTGESTSVRIVRRPATHYEKNARVVEA
jgi:teichuronic acid biosynthesis glycosyltransferase TuaH